MSKEPRMCSVTILRVDGTEEEHVIAKGVLGQMVHKLIGAEVTDTVSLRSRPGMVMIVDDTGMVDGKPINPAGTKLYHEKCGYPTPNSIHGDVAICTDKDFA